MHCVHSNTDEKSTPLYFDYPNGIDSQPQVTMGPGDKLVNIESLRVCQKWKDAGKLVH